jgi:hypothetical protein
MAYALSQSTVGALSPAEQRRITAALSRVNETASGRGFNLSANPAMQVQANPGLAMGPTPSLSGPIKSLAGSTLMGLGSGFGFGPLGALGLANTALNPSSLTNTGQTNIPGIGNIATSPGPFGPMLSMTGFGGIVKAAGALNAANLNRIAATDPNATAVSGPGFGGFFSEGTFSGTLPGGLDPATKRAIVKDIAKQHYDRQRNGGGGGFGGESARNDPRNGPKGDARSGGGYRAA